MNNITSRDLFHIFLKNIFIILLSAIVFASGAYVYCEKFTPERYKAQGEFLVTNGNISEKNPGITDDTANENLPGSTTPGSDSVANTDVAASINLLPTIRSILSGSGIYKEFAGYLKENTQYNYSYSALKGAANVSQEEELSFYITISFELGSREDAIAVTNHFLKFVPIYVENKIEGCRVVPDTGCESAVKTAPLTSSTVTVAAVFGIILSYAVMFLIYILNSTIKSDEDFSARYNIPVIGNIPDFSVSSSSSSKSSSKKGQGGK